MSSHPQESLQIDSIFIHIPKAAGTSLKNKLYEHYTPERCLKVWGVSHGGDIDVGAALADHEDIRPDTKNLMGHFPLALARQNTPIRESFRKYGRFVISSIRDPVERLISDYNYILNTPTHDRRDSTKDGLSSYLLAAPENEQAKWLDVQAIDWDTNTLKFVHDDAFTERLVIVDSAVLDAALPNIVRNFFGTGSPVGRLNVAKGAKDAAISAEVRHAVEERNRLDAELYRFVAQQTFGTYLSPSLRPSFHWAQD